MAFLEFHFCLADFYGVLFLFKIVKQNLNLLEYGRYMNKAGFSLNLTEHLVRFNLAQIRVSRSGDKLKSQLCPPLHFKKRRSIFSAALPWLCEVLRPCLLAFSRLARVIEITFLDTAFDPV